MGFQVSPGVSVQEIDLTTVIPAVSTTEAGIGGVFSWGPVEERVLVSNEDQLVDRFGKPSDSNFETWLSAASFLAYGDKLYVSRAASNTSLNSVAFGSSPGDNVLIKNLADFTTQQDSLPANSHFYAKYPGVMGNSLKVSVCGSAAQYNSYVFTSNNNTSIAMTFTVGANSATLTATSNSASNTAVTAAAVSALNSISVGDYLVAGNSSIGSQYLKVTNVSAPAASGNATSVATISFANRYSLSDPVAMTSASTSASSIQRFWEHYGIVDGAPGTSKFVADRNPAGAAASDELHVVVTDEDGLFSGLPGTVLEVWKNLSRATDALGEQGGTLYYKNTLKDSSKYIWAANDLTGLASAPALTLTLPTGTSYSASFSGGTSPDTESNVSLGALSRAYNQYIDSEQVDVSILIQGKARGGVNGEQLANYIIDNICEVRKDCILTVSPDIADTVNNPFNAATDVLAYKNSLRSSSYYFMDSGHKYMYDRYNDVYRWVPLNGDIAGAMVRSDETRDPWWSPAGFTRGNIKNVVQLAFNPNKAQRDQLYKGSVNPVVSFPGQGVVLYGDKTGLSRPSAFDRINVRRLFIVLEKAIATAAKFSLFEFNDEFTRALFRNMVEPYLRDVQGRRGIFDFKVICDNTNNTAEVIDGNRFVGTIIVKPARSINYINLSFVAVRTAVEFDEIIGKV